MKNATAMKSWSEMSPADRKLALASPPRNYRSFHYAPGPHAPQLAIQAHDMTLAECQLLRGIVMDNRIDSPNYQLGRACGVFLQGYEPPCIAREESGWVLAEFWTSNEEAVHAFVKHVNEKFAELYSPKSHLRKAKP